MRSFFSTVLAGCLVTAVVAQVPPPPLSPASIERAQAILADTRKAMGGDKLAAVKTLVASGRTRRVPVGRV